MAGEKTAGGRGAGEMGRIAETNQANPPAPEFAFRFIRAMPY